MVHPAVRLGLFLGLAPGAALGIGRFAYALVLPTMQETLGLSFSEAGLLGSANTFGYLVGALFSYQLLYATGFQRGLYLGLLLQFLSLLSLGFTDAFWMLMVLRFLQGIFGGVVFVGGAALVLASGGKALALGYYFGGVGIGICLSPIALVSGEWQLSWVYLALLALGMSFGVVFPKVSEPAPRKLGQETGLAAIRFELIAYGLYGAGYIGYMTFVTTGLDTGLAPFWFVLGLGAALNGVVWGRVIEYAGPKLGLVLVLFTLASSSFFPLLQWAPFISSFLFGLSFLGVITAISDIFRQRLQPGQWARAMAFSTAIFALGQALGPSLSGLAGDFFGGAIGALGLSTFLLAIAVSFAAWPQANK